MGLPEVRVRKALPSDLNAVKSLADDNKSYLGFVLRPVLAAGIERGWLLVAEMADYVIVGFANYRHRRDEQTTLYEICVDQAFRGQGLGRALIASLAIECAALGKAKICLRTPTDIPANDFYRALGFRLATTEPGKHKQLNLWTGNVVELSRQ